MATNAITLKKLLTNFTYSVVDIKKITPIILHYRWFILGVSSGVMSATSLLAITTKPTYQSYMQILVSYNSDELSPTNHREKTTKDLNKPQLSSIDYSSQIKLMLSDKLVQKAVNLLHGDYPQMTVEDIYSNSQIDQVSSLPPTQLPADSEVNQHSNQTFLLSFTDKDPLRTKRVLQALEKVYKDYNIYQKDQRINQGLVFVNKHLPQLQQDVLKAEKKLETFRKQNNLIDPVLQSQILLQSLADIQKQRQTTRAQLQDVQAQHNSLEQAIASSNQNKKNINDSFQTRQNQSLISELTQTFEALKEARIVYTEKHPIIQKLVQKQQIIITLLQQEEKNKAITINSKSKISEQRVPKLENDLTKLKITALGLIAHDQDLVKSEQE
ncbi:Wzz/FepE/Etk N-terminal domain-containing protein, partial [Dolichospermum sp. ST_con]|nr:Wzz/FepE/Etk N-terminal domain-containing protein [Dolichospermum sp. ST_con]